MNLIEAMKFSKKEQKLISPVTGVYRNKKFKVRNGRLLIFSAGS